MKKPWLKLILISTALALVAGLIAALPLEAQAERLVITSLATWSCDPSTPNTAYWQASPRPGTTTRITLANPRVRTRVIDEFTGETELTDTVMVINGYVNNFGISRPPENTFPNDVLYYRVELLDPAGTVYAADQIVYNCRTGEQHYLDADYLPEELRPNALIAKPLPLASSMVAPHLETPFNGEVPCAVFAVSYPGEKVISPNEFSACQPYWPEVTVACMNDQATWTDAEVRDPILHGDGWHTIITQTGTCAVFPATSAAAGPEEAAVEQ
jgi:hypothetical protein